MNTIKLAVNVAFLLVGFVLASIVFPMHFLIVSGNAIFLGVLITVVAVYWRTILDAFRPGGSYGRVQQFALGVALLWASLAMFLTLFVLSRVNGLSLLDAYNPILIGFVLYVAIIAGVMQITAPGWGEGYMHGRDRLTLAIAILFGFVVTLIAFLWQWEMFL